MHIVFSGRVQGVGFRYTVLRVSEPFKVAGFVRNLPDGNVEIIAEGVEQELSDLLNSIRSSHVGRYIAREQVRWLSASGEFDQFRIFH
jgi:acylphosphatase